MIASVRTMCLIHQVVYHVIIIAYSFGDGLVVVVNRKPFFSAPIFFNNEVRRNRNKPARGGIKMYFDDISRNVKLNVPLWNPQDGAIGPRINNKVPPSNAEYDGTMKYAKDKMEALNRFFSKHDEVSASSLSQEEVFSSTTDWMTKSEEMESYLSSERKQFIDKRMTISTSSSLVGCISDFWKSVVQEIEIYKDDPKENTNVMLIYPNCAELYDYQAFSLMRTVINFSQDQCIYLGQQQLQIELFHPDFKNEPNTFWSKHHSPFPCMALHLSYQKDQSFHYIGKWYSTMDTLTRNNIEDLFNSPAAELNLENNSHDANVQHDEHEDQGVVNIFKEWLALNTENSNHPLVDNVIHLNNEPLHHYVDTVQYRWSVSRVHNREKAYADMWTLIADLFQSVNDTHQEITSTANQNLLHHTVVDQSCEDISSNPDKIISSILIFTNFTNYNANDFKKFAISINAALKQIAGRKLSMEIFHPEYVAREEIHSKMRRSPFPAIQVSFKLSRKL